MKTMDVTEKTSLKELVTLAKQESEVVLTEGQKPVAKVVPITAEPELPGKLPGRKLGLHAGAWVVSDDFDQPLPDEYWLGQE
jgi:antitoxin (DNA-binding transcriptional repressor) of toxin-antitoxin stability system